VKFLFVGGPWHGKMRDVLEGVHVVAFAEFPHMAYHRTHAHTGGSVDPDWWMRNLPEPSSVVVYEWHGRDWVPPAVAAIRAAVEEAAAKLG